MNTRKPKYNILAVKTVGEKGIGVAFPSRRAGSTSSLTRYPPTGAACGYPERDRSNSGTEE